MALSGVDGTGARLEALLIVLATELDTPTTLTPVAALAAQYRSTVLAIDALPSAAAADFVDVLAERRAEREAREAAGG